MKEVTIKGYELSAKEVWDVARAAFGPDVKIKIDRDDDCGSYASGDFEGYLCFRVEVPDGSYIDSTDLLEECGKYLRANLPNADSVLDPRSDPGVAAELADWEGEELPYDDSIPGCFIYARPETEQRTDIAPVITAEAFFRNP